MMIVTGETPISVQISWAVMASYGIQFAKKLDKIPFINYEAENANRLFSILVAAAIGAGITFTFNRTAGIFTVTGLTLANLYHFVSFGVQQFAMQHGVYKTMIAPALPGKLQEEVRKNGHADVRITESMVGK